MQAGLRLCCSQTPEDRFSRAETHMIVILKVQKDSFFKCHTEVQIQVKVYAHQIRESLIKALSWVKVQNFQNPELSNLKTCIMPTKYSQFLV